MLEKHFSGSFIGVHPYNRLVVADDGSSEYAPLPAKISLHATADNLMRDRLPAVWNRCGLILLEYSYTSEQKIAEVVNFAKGSL